MAVWPKQSTYEEQLLMGWPGLAKEATEICRQIGVNDVNEKNVEKSKTTKI